jgi:hypothetical protein
MRRALYAAVGFLVGFNPRLSGSADRVTAGGVVGNFYAATAQRGGQKAMPRTSRHPSPSLEDEHESPHSCGR